MWQIKEKGRSNTGEFNASKRGLDNFRKIFNLKKKIKITGEMTFANQGSKFPDVIKKITERKDICQWTGFNCR